MSHNHFTDIRIPVTKPFLPPLEEYDALLKQVWDRNWLTNNGPMVQQLEEDLNRYLKTSQLLLVTNGTIALQIGIKILGLKGDIITTPFSYVATTSSIIWEGCRPVFVDIDPSTLNIDPAMIEKAITPETTAILATHVYGNPCDIDAIQSIARKNRIKVIFDAAHCFGSRYKGRTIYEYGDLSVASFHATKLYHTVEGGALITSDPELATRIRLMRNFGHNGPYRFSGVGINGKMSEFHAIMGIVNLRYADLILSRRKELSGFYDKALQETAVTKPAINDKADFNFAYYPVIFGSESELIAAMESLMKKGIGSRRYFYPSLDNLDYVPHGRALKNTDDLSRRILCLPLYHELKEADIREITGLIAEALD